MGRWPYRAARRRSGALSAAIVLCLSAAGCGSGARAEAPGSTRAALQQYLRQVEPIRLAVNRLLEGADPILAALHEHRVNAHVAGARMDRLERRFADFTVQIALIEPRLPKLAALHAEYAQTYLLEDAYLSALANGISNGELGGLPDTQAEQRASIIGWRTGLTVLARRARLSLPADLQAAGRGEIAPSPRGGS